MIDALALQSSRIRRMQGSPRAAGSSPSVSRAIAFFALFTSLLNTNAYAQRLEPMRYDLEAAGGQTSLRIDNTRSTDLTFEITPYSIDSVDDAGKETLSLAEEDFLIFPPQAIIPAGGAQIIRIKYVGDPAIDMSKAYRVSVKQIPLDLTSSGGSGVGVGVNFLTLVNIVPENAAPKLAVTSLEPGSDAKTWRVAIENTGARYARLSDTEWTIDTGGRTMVVNDKELSQALGGQYNLIFPNSTRTIEVRALSDEPPSALKVSIRAK